MCDVARYIVLLAKSRLWNYLARRICVYRWRSLCSLSWCWEQRSGTTASPSMFSRTTSRRRTDTFSCAEENRTRDLSRRGPSSTHSLSRRIAHLEDTYSRTTRRDTFEPTTTTAAPFRYPWALARAQFILSLVSVLFTWPIVLRRDTRNRIRARASIKTVYQTLFISVGWQSDRTTRLSTNYMYRLLAYINMLKWRRTFGANIITYCCNKLHV